MAYEFAENEFELETNASSSRGSGPPRKVTGVGLLDPPVPRKRPPGPVFLAVLGGLLLLGLCAGILLLLFAHR